MPRADGLTAIARNMTFKKQLKFMGLRIGAFVADTVLRYDEKAEDASERKSLSMQARVSHALWASRA